MNWWTGRKHTLESRLKMREAKLKSGHRPPSFLGRKHTEEWKINMSLKMKGRIPKNLKLAQEKAHLSKRGKSPSLETCRRMSESAHKGKNHPNWKGGITTQDAIERVKFKKTIQKKVFERDNFTCQLCRIKGVDLQVDHIQSWSEYVTLRFSMDNCRTLCAKCHYKLTYGKEMPDNIKGWGHNLLERERVAK